jgi:hypothetical protein
LLLARRSETLRRAGANHWRVIWFAGITEQGSSGSPLINNSRRVIGQLYGGNSSCTALDSADWYGKFSVSWNNSTNPKRRLSDWLDPNNTGATILDGCSNLVNFTNQIVTTDTTVTSCGNINVQNVTVTNPAKLTLKAAGKVNIIRGFEVKPGAKLEIIKIK